MYEESIDLLKEQGVGFESGLTTNEIVEAEKIYDIKFPDSLRSFLMIALPISKGFYKWRNFDVKNVEYIKSVIKQPINDINDKPEEIYWCDSWGEEPEDENCMKEEVRKQLSKAPKLIPIYSHRYMPMVSVKNPPILSVHGTDVIYYGKDLEDYYRVEYGYKKQEKIAFECIEPISFWSEIM